MEFYDMDGNVLTLDEWAEMFEDTERRIVAQTDLPGGCWVSTVLLGLDHNFMDPGNPPIIFETMVFASRENMADLDCRRYATKEEAQEGHAAAVTRWTGWTPGEDYPEDAEASFLTQFIGALHEANEMTSPDAMVVMYPKDVADEIAAREEEE
jgi:hypothetical protein